MNDSIDFQAQGMVEDPYLSRVKLIGAAQTFRQR